MSRLRARLSSNKNDKEAFRRLADSNQAMHKALEVYRRVAKTGTPVERRRAERAVDSIRRAMKILGGVQSIASRYDTSDTDLVPEADKVAKTRIKPNSGRVE